MALGADRGAVLALMLRPRRATALKPLAALR